MKKLKDTKKEMIRLYIKNDMLRVHDGCIAKWSKLEDRVKECIKQNGEYGHKVRGKYRCDHSMTLHDACPFYFEGCNRTSYNYYIMNEDE